MVPPPNAWSTTRTSRDKSEDHKLGRGLTQSGTNDEGNKYGSGTVADRYTTEHLTQG